MSIKIKSYAKINLTLDILGVREGYHLLDSVVCSIDLSDEIVATKRADDEVTIRMFGKGSEGIPPEQNNAVKAAKLFMQTFGTHGVDITVYKNIPMGAGLGGSSADAAGVLNAMARLYGVGSESDLATLAARIGADVRFQLKGGFARMSGFGEVLTPIATDLPLNFILFVPEQGVPTGACYGRYDSGNMQSPNTTQAALSALQNGDIEALGASLSNALYLPAVSLNGDVAQAMEAARSFAPCGANMSGSGSCVYALFSDAEFCRYAQSRYRGNAQTILAKAIDPQKESILWLKKD